MRGLALILGAVACASGPAAAPTGKTVQELGDEWKKFHEQRFASVENKETNTNQQKSNQ